VRRGWAPARLRRFAALHRQVEGVVQRCGRETVDFVLVDVRGDWERAVATSEDEVRAIARDLGVRLNEGWNDPRLARRMNVRDVWSDPEGRRRAL
jgi:hypothetical protein